LAALRPRLTNSVFALKRQAIIALAQAASAAGVAAAVAVGNDADWRWRSVAAEAFGAARARDRLDGQLADPDGRVVAQALQALQRIVPADDSSLSARARALLTHADPAVRSVAADLLARHPNGDDVDLLVVAYTRAAGDRFNDARLSAVSALGAIAASSAAGRQRVAARFVSVPPRPDDYLVRQLDVDTLPDPGDALVPVLPSETRPTPFATKLAPSAWPSQARTPEAASTSLRIPRSPISTAFTPSLVVSSGSAVPPCLTRSGRAIASGAFIDDCRFPMLKHG